MSLVVERVNEVKEFSKKLREEAETYLDNMVQADDPDWAGVEICDVGGVSRKFVKCCDIIDKLLHEIEQLDILLDAYKRTNKKRGC